MTAAMIRRRLVYARSGNSLRAAIALELSGHAFERTAIDLGAGDQRAAAHLALNPAGKVPVYIEEGDAPFVLTQSGAIMAYVLREARPELTPVDRHARALVTASVDAAISDIAVQNVLLRYMDFDPRNALFLRERLLHAIAAAFTGLADRPFLAGDALSLADIAHYPVVHMRRRLLTTRSGFRHVVAWADRLRALAPFARAIDYCGLELPAEDAP